MVGGGYNVLRILSQNGEPTKDRLGRNPADGHRPYLTPPPIPGIARQGHLGQLLGGHTS